MQSIVPRLTDAERFATAAAGTALLWMAWKMPGVRPVSLPAGLALLAFGVTEGEMPSAARTLTKSSGRGSLVRPAETRALISRP
jgi:hypothetical protein